MKGSKHKSNTTLSNYLRAKSSFNSSYAGGRKSLNATVMLGQQPEAGRRNAYRTSGGSSKSGLVPSSFVTTFKDLEGKLNPYRQPQARELQNKTQPIPRQVLEIAAKAEAAAFSTGTSVAQRQHNEGR